MSVVLQVHDDRLIIRFQNASGQLELPFRTDGRPLADCFVPGYPPHIQQTTTGKSILYDGWLWFTDGHGKSFPLVPVGPQGTMGDGVTFQPATRYTDCDEDSS